MRSWMQEARRQAKMTMSETASRIGISESYYSMIEAGERQKKLDITLAVKIAETFGIALESIVAYESEQK